MRRALTVISATCLLALGLSACEQKPKTEERTATTGAAAPAEPVAPVDKAGTPTTEPAAQKVAEETEDIPTVVDFEEQAEQNITPANIEQELIVIEKEIGK
jgi:hypothetical protein